VAVVGLALVPLPGPGWLVVFLGLGLLATEFAWARRLLSFARHKVTAFSHWFAARTRVLRGLLTLALVLLVAALAGGYVAWRGVPFL